MSETSGYELRMRRDAACNDLFDRLLIALGPEVICDIGAFNGDDSRRFAALMPSSTVVAFEASPRNVSTFWEPPNAPAQPPNLQLAHMAVTDKAGMVEFHELASDPGAGDWRRAAGSILDRVSQQDFALVTVPGGTLDDYLVANGLSERSLALWVDVEGATDKVIRGAREALSRTRLIRVEVEWWAEWEGQRLAPEIKGILESYGFVCVADSFVPETTSQSDLIFVKSNLLGWVVLEHEGQYSVPPEKGPFTSEIMAVEREIESGPGTLVLDDGVRIRKTYLSFAGDYHGRIHREASFLRAFSSTGLLPELLEQDYSSITMSKLQGTHLNTFLDHHPDLREQTLDELAWGIFGIHCAGWNHCDLNPSNIFCEVDDNGHIRVTFVDGEYARKLPPLLPCAESFDLAGKGWWISDHVGHPHSAYSLIDGAPGDLFLRVVARLRSMLYEVTGSQSGKVDTRYVYHSLDLPGFKVDLPEAQRDVKVRFDLFGLSLNGKTLVDVGSNLGGMCLEAARRGATCVGLESDSERVAVANLLARFGGRNAKFEVFDVEQEEPPKADVILFCAVDGYLANPMAAYEKVARATGEVLIFETNRADHAVPTDAQWVELWRNLGFKEILHLGTSTDDVRESNHWRRIMKCSK